MDHGGLSLTFLKGRARGNTPRGSQFCFLLKKELGWGPLPPIGDGLQLSAGGSQKCLRNLNGSLK
jgi:hypothetical protein